MRGYWPAIFIGAITAVTSAQAELTISRVQCEYATNPLGIDTPQPRLGWVLSTSRRGVMQLAYQVLVASSAETLQKDQGDLWDSGKTSSDDSIHVVYAGRPLRSGQRVWWKVRVWDGSGESSAWSEPAWWEMALLDPADWQGKWICSDRPLPVKDEDFYADHPAPLFRKEFTAEKKIARARAYVSGLGYYELYLNGHRVGDQVLDPGWTTYSKRVLYSTYDVTDLLKQGPNAVGAIVGNGWYNPLPLRFWGRFNLREPLTIGRPRLMLQLNLEYADGTRASIVTDESWKTADSPILRNSLYLGEIYDARREQSGWNEAGFEAAAVAEPSATTTEATPHPSPRNRGEPKGDGPSPLNKGGLQGGSAQGTTPTPAAHPLLEADSDARPRWRPVALSTEPVGQLQAQYAPPIRITRTLKPVAVTEPTPGVYIFDLGQNFAGWVRLNVTGPAGTTVKLRYGELLYPDGKLNPMTSVCGQIKAKGIGGPGAPDVAWQSDTYILKGAGEETYTPRFTFHGFRYVELTGLSAKPPLDAVTGLRLNADVRPVGRFECSDPLFNRIHEMVQWTILSNLFSVQSDCPHREKFGYGGDIVASSEAVMFNYDMARFYAKTVQDYQDAVRPNGGLTETAPFVGIADEGFGEGTGPIAWGTAHPLLLQQLSDYYGNRRLMEAQYATAARWADFLHAQAKDGLIQHGIGDHESLVAKPTPVTSTAFYFHNLTLLAQLAKTLGKPADVKRYQAWSDEVLAAFHKAYAHPETGVYGQQVSQCAQAIAFAMQMVYPEESEAAYDALALDIAKTHQNHLTTGIFGTKYLLSVLSGLGHADLAYAIVQQKDFPGYGHMLERGATTLWEHWEYSDNTYSHNHPMFASVDEWFYRYVAGIGPGFNAEGWKEFIIAPRPGGGLTYARAEYDSIRGPIRSEWHQDGDTLTLKVTIPPNATALVCVPANQGDTVTEGGRPADQSRQVRFRGWESHAAAYAVGSGEYEFRVTP